MTNVDVKDATKDALDLLKVHERESYNDVIARLVVEHNQKVKA